MLNHGDLVRLQMQIQSKDGEGCGLERATTAQTAWGESNRCCRPLFTVSRSTFYTADPQGDPHWHIDPLFHAYRLNEHLMLRVSNNSKWAGTISVFLHSFQWNREMYQDVSALRHAATWGERRFRQLKFEKGIWINENQKPGLAKRLWVIITKCN